MPEETADFSPAHAIRPAPSGGRRPPSKRLLGGIAAVTAAVLGAAPHVLHQGGPFAGAALLSGTTGSVVFGVVGFVAAIPLLLRVRRRTGGWRVPGALLALFVVVFSISTFVVAPALSDGGDDGAQATGSRAAPPLSG